MAIAVLPAEPENHETVRLKINEAIASINASNGGFVHAGNYSGYDNTGATDSTAAFVAAKSDLGANGGIIFSGPGTFQVDDLELDSVTTYVGAGRRATNFITRTSSPSSAMFRYKGSSTLHGGGIKGMRCIGNASSDAAKDATQKCIDITASTEAENFEVDIEAKNFTHAYHGSQDDRSIVFKSCWFFNCTYGWWIVNNHPIFEGLNEAESCTWGFTGNTIFDCAFNGTKAVRNVYGYVPQSGGSLSSCQFTGAICFGNTYGMDLYEDCTVTGGLYVPQSVLTTEYLIALRSTGNIISSATFRDSASSYSTTADIWLASTTTQNNVIANNNFSTNSVNILHDNAGSFTRNNITNNVKKNGTRSFLISNNGLAFRNNICQNNLYTSFTGAAANTDMIAIGASASSGGNNIGFNTIRFEVAGQTNWRYSINADVQASHMCYNIARNAPYNFTNADGNTQDVGNQYQ